MGPHGLEFVCVFVFCIDPERAQVSNNDRPNEQKESVQIMHWIAQIRSRLLILL